MAKKIVISCAMTGTASPKGKNPAVPTTAEEIAEDVYRVWKAGAAVVHMHMRNEDGSPSMEAARFRKTIDLIRAHEDCDVIINCTSSGSDHAIPDEVRLEHYQTIPEIEMGSYDCGTINWGCHDVFNNSPAFLEKLAQCYLDHNVKPEVELFDSGMIGNMKYYMNKVLLKQPVWCQCIMNVLGGTDGTVKNLLHLVEQIPEGCKWSASGIGTSHQTIMYAALALGCDGIRVGLEDNLYYSKGVLATNEMLVERAARLIRDFGYEVATPAEAREIMDIKPLVH